MRVFASLLLVLNFCVPLGRTAAAQDPSTKNDQLQRDAATGAFNRGLKAVSNENWEEALLAFETSFELEASPKTRINIALVQIQLGLLVEAYAHLQAISSSTELDSKTRSAAGEQAADLSRKIPEVELELRNMLPTDRLFVRGVETRLEPGQRSVRVNPGRHTINIMRGGNIVVSETVLLREGAVTKVVLDAGSESSGPDSPAQQEQDERKVDQVISAHDQPSDDEGGSVLEEWWFWTVVGVVVAGGVVAGVALASSGREPQCDSDPLCFDLRN